MAIPSHEGLIPRAAELCAALRQRTEELSAELLSATECAPAWSGFEWGIARAVVAIHGIAGILLRDLKWDGVPVWRDFLAREVAATRESHARSVHALQEINAAAVRAGVPILALKGCALHSAGVYLPGERPMADIDLLVRPEHGEIVSGLLENAGFKPGSRSWKHQEYTRDALPTLENTRRVPTAMLKIDLHTRLAERIAYREIALPHDPFGGSDEPGVRGYSSIVVLLCHLLLHAAGNMSSCWLRAIQLLDIALVAERLTADEWLAVRCSRWPDRWCLYPPLLLTARYFPHAIDISTLRDLESSCPPWLRGSVARQSLTDVSASNARIQALPELAWCTSFGGLVRYVCLRVLPEKSELDDLRKLARTAEYGRDQAWFTMSQPARIASWLFRRPLRPATIHAVLRALSPNSVRHDGH